MLSHEEAIGHEWAERYVLGELSEPERERFEEHLFDCPACSETVRTAHLYVRGVEATLKRKIISPMGETAKNPKSARRERPVWWRPIVALPFAAMLCLTVGAGSQYLALRKALSPQAVASFIIRPQVRGEFFPKIRLPEVGHFVELELELVGETAPQSQYRWHLRPAGATQVLMTGEERPPENGPLKLLLPRKELRAARYELVLRDESGHAFIYRFEI